MRMINNLFYSCESNSFYNLVIVLYVFYACTAKSMSSHLVENFINFQHHFHA